MRRFKNFICAMLLASLMIFAATVEAAELVILHTNDIHARVLNTDDGGKSMGLAEMVAAIKTLKSQNKNNLWLYEGDTFNGMPAINISKCENMLTLLNIAGLNAMTPGNHDFNYGIDGLLNLNKKAKFDIIAANVVYKDNDKLILTPYKIYNLSGLKVGVFGLATPETAYKARPSFLSKVKFLNPYEVAKNMVKTLRPKCDVIIALTHLGVLESSEFNSVTLAKEVDGIDLIVDGHSHTLLPAGLTINDTLIVQTGAHAYNLGKTTIELDGKKITSIRAELLDADAVKKINPTPDKNITAAIKSYERANKKIFNQVVAKNEIDLPFDISLIRTQETELGDLVADAFRWRTGADIAVINSGGIRSGIPKGNVTYGDAIAIFPFGNQLQVVEIQGKLIREMLENGVSEYPDTAGKFLQVSGIRFEFLSKNHVGNRIGKIFVNNAPLDDNKLYTLAATDFMIEGGDGYDCLKKLLVIGKFGTLEEVLIEYLQEVGIKNIDTGRIIRR